MFYFSLEKFGKKKIMAKGENKGVLNIRNLPNLDMPISGWQKKGFRTAILMFMSSIHRRENGTLIQAKEPSAVEMWDGVAPPLEGDYRAHHSELQYSVEETFLGK